MLFSKRKTSLVVAAIICFLNLSPAYAAKSVEQLKKEMQERTESIKKTEKEINSKKAEKDEALEKRNSLDLQISAMLDDISDVEAVIKEKENEINEKNSEIELLNIQIEETNEKLKTRLKVIYEYGATSYLQLLLDSNGLADLVTRLSVIKKIYNYDKKVISDYVDTKEQVEAAKQLIENEQKEQVEAKNILENKKSNLEALKSEKQKIIDDLNNDIEALKKEEQQIEDDYNSLKRELEAALSASSSKSTQKYTGSGKFAWPSASSTRITSYYGYRTHPVTGVKNKLHRGIDIGAPMGSDVLAAEAGTVVTAGWNNSYGYYVTINHGGGYVTLYAHNSKLLVSKGDNVSRGQVIAKCGSTGNSTGPHIHFEVMLNGNLQNPMNYL